MRGPLPTTDSRAWDFGDGETSTAENPSHEYLWPGQYPVVFTATWSSRAYTATHLINVSNPVQAQFTASPLQGTHPLTVTFSDQSQTTSGTITDWLWDFGDGTTSIEQQPSHVYTSAGQYTVQLIASTGTYSATKVKTNYISVSPPYQAVITYTYDGLYRLTQATATGSQPYAFEYAYDAVGNRTTQTATMASPQVTNYVYDEANRLISANDQEYTWDDNGNLVSDGTKTYTYNQANQLTVIEGDGISIAYHYNGDGARLQQIVNESPTTYTLDLATPLPVVLQSQANEVTTQYVYVLGTRPLAQYANDTAEYLLADALGSVRQIVDLDGNVTLAKSYEPYGSVLTSTGTASSIFGYSGEQIDTYIKLLFLRARYYSPENGGFLSKDMWQGDYTKPQSLNGWTYVEGNPVSNVDPTGYSKCGATFAEDADCQVLGQRLQEKARTIKTDVQSGALLPVEGFAQLADYATTDLFEYDLVDVMWGMTSVLYGFDSNHHMYLWWTAYKGLPPDSPYFIGQDWLPYKQYYPVNPVGEHVYSERGDWNSNYWDDTANQAFHMWFYAAVTYYDGAWWAYKADEFHDPYQNGETQWDISEEDHNLALKGIELGRLISAAAPWGNCAAIIPEQVFNIGAWIRANLKGE